MRRIIALFFALLFASSAHAQNTIEKDLVGLGMRPELADYFGNIFRGGLNLFTTGDTIAIQEATAASKCMGTATANGTTAVTVSTTCAATNARIFLSATSDGTGTATNDQGACWATNIVDGVSFDLDCPDASNNAAYNWLIIKEAP